MAAVAEGRYAGGRASVRRLIDRRSLVRRRAMWEARAMTEVPFDKQEQYDRVAAGLLPGERILAVYDATGAGTGFIGVTDRRVILQDNSFVGKKVALTSIPYSRVSAVSFLSDSHGDFELAERFSRTTETIQSSNRTVNNTDATTRSAVHALPPGSAVASTKLKVPATANDQAAATLYCVVRLDTVITDLDFSS
jgi:hypothetical protein